MIAQNLARGESRNILLYMATEVPTSSSTWLYGMPAIQGVYSVFRQTEYYVQISVNPVNQPEHNYKVIKSLIERQSIDGILYFSTWSIDKQVHELLENLKFPYILVGNNNPKTPENDVLVNIPDATAELVRYLHDRGHRSFGTILGFQNQIHTQQRLHAFKNEISKMDLLLEEKYIKTYGKYEGYYFGLPTGSKIKILYIEDEYYAKILILEPSISLEWFEEIGEVWTLRENLYDVLYTVEE